MEIYVLPITILVWWLGSAQHSVAWFQQYYCNLWLLMYVITLDGTDQLNPSGTIIIQDNINNKLTFSIFSQCWDGAKSRKSSWQKTKIWLSYIINDVVFTKCDQNILSSVPGGCFSNDSRALQNNLPKIHNATNHIYGENFKLKICMCAQSIALGTRTKFQLEILIRSTISAIHKFRDNFLESSRNFSETTPRMVNWLVMDLDICMLWMRMHYRW